jgi:hypothetical protein
MTKGPFGTTIGAAPGATSQGCQPNALGGGCSTREVPVFPLSQAKGVRAGKGQLRPALTRLCGASRGYDRICIGGTQGGARGERRRAGIGNEAAPVWPCGDVGCTRLVIEDGRA